jgi:hypothetical protein
MTESGRLSRRHGWENKILIGHALIRYAKNNNRCVRYAWSYAYKQSGERDTLLTEENFGNNSI